MPAPAQSYDSFEGATVGLEQLTSATGMCSSAPCIWAGWMSVTAAFMIAEDEWNETAICYPSGDNTCYPSAETFRAMTVLEPEWKG